MSKIFVFSGFSGAGKGTIISNVLKTISNCEQVPNSVTREKRKDDPKNRNYYTVKQFKKMIKNNMFIEHDFHFENYYGTRKKDLEKLLEKRKIVVLELDVNGAMKFKKKYSNTKLIFILPPSIKILKKRLLKRGKITEEQFKLRSKRMEKELSFIKKYDYVIVNDVLGRAVDEVSKIIKNETK